MILTTIWEHITIQENNNTIIMQLFLTVIETEYGQFLPLNLNGRGNNNCTCSHTFIFKLLMNNQTLLGFDGTDLMGEDATI